MLITELSGKQINFFLHYCQSIGITGHELQMVEAIAQTSIKYYRGSKHVRQQMREWQDLENQWYGSLETTHPFFQVYGAKFYIADLWACWVVYSRKYLQALCNTRAENGKTIAELLQMVESIVDLGCGIGITTAAMTQIFPNAANIYGTNLLQTQQANFCAKISQAYNFTVIGDVREINGKCDLVFASEYFEHFQQPVQHLDDIIQQLAPQYLLIANSFGAKSIGHFNQYSVNGQLVNARMASKQFNLHLRKAGFMKIKTRLWNNRPALWQKQ